MKPLRVLVIVKNRPAAFEREKRNMGHWSYPVEPFTWDFVTLGKNFKLNLKEIKGRYDFVWHEDGGSWGEYIGDGVPVIYYAIDSTLGDKHHYLPRLEQAKKADITLVDHDRLERFASTGKPVFRHEFAVNDHIFRDYGLPKDIDVAFHCGGSDERQRVRVKLHEICAAHGWTYTSGVLPLAEYAQAMNRAKIVVNWPRIEGNRPHRVFDAMACRACLLSAPVPNIEHEYKYQSPLFRDFEQLESNISSLLEWQYEGFKRGGGQEWEGHAHMGYFIATNYHTWAVRAQQLRELVNQEFGL